MKNNNQKLMVYAFTAFLLAGASPLTAHAATLTGKVSFEGEAPVPKPVNFGAEKQCAMMHGDKMPVAEELVINPNNTLKWTLVYVKEGAVSSPAPEQAVEIDQKGCMFLPHVAVARVGQKVVFKNGDPVLHNVRSESKTNKAFNIAQPIQGMTTTKTFTQPEIGVKMRCDVHFWMASFIHVLDHPFHAVTGDDGNYQIKDLPTGTYTLEAWHEKLGVQTAQITVTEGETKTTDFVFKSA